MLLITIFIRCLNQLSVNVPRRVVATITFLYLCVGLFFSNAGYYTNELFPRINKNSILGKSVIVRNKYADRFTPRTVLRIPFIKSYVLEKNRNHIELSIPLTRSLEDSLLVHCGNIKKFQERGLHWSEYFRIGNFNTNNYDTTFNVEDNAKAILACFNERMNITIDDSIALDVRFKFAKHESPFKSILIGYIPTKKLPSGLHDIGLEGIYLPETYYIPFLKD